MEPKILVLYQVQYFDAKQNQWLKSSWKMTVADAEIVYANRKYKILRETREEMRIDGCFTLPPSVLQTA